MVDKKYYDILNMITWNNVINKCFEYLQERIYCEDDLVLEIWRKNTYTEEEIDKYKIPTIWRFYLMSSLKKDYDEDYKDNEAYLKKIVTERIKKVNILINDFIKNNNFSNEFYNEPICW